MASSERFLVSALTEFAQQLLQKAGLSKEQATVVAGTLIDGDLLGHDTHGLALLIPYITEIEKGTMSTSGEPKVISDRPAAMVWDGKRLPGPWLVHKGIDALIPRAREYGTASLVIHHSHHIACLAAYLLRATEAGFLLILSSSDPSVASVAPFGGTRAVFTPNPIAVGIPTSATPFLVDISASITTNGMSNRLHKAGQQFEEEWMLDANGYPSRNPGVLAENPPGTILPLGGLSAGHKGFGLALLIEALTAGLSGYGRADHPTGWGASVFMSLYDPIAFGGEDAFVRQMDWIADACRHNPPRPGTEQVRMPGDRGMTRRAQQLQEGVFLHPSIPPALRECAKKYGVPYPEVI